MALTKRMWTSLAKRYALARWCWDDCADDIEDRANMAEERPDLFIDRMAERWGLNDPSEPWAVPGYVPEDVELLRKIIRTRWGVSQEDRCRVCNALIGIGIRELHLGICDDCRPKEIAQ